MISGNFSAPEAKLRVTLSSGFHPFSSTLLCDLCISIYFIIPYIGRVGYRVERNLSTSEAKFGGVVPFSGIRFFSFMLLYNLSILVCFINLYVRSVL